MDDGMIVNGIDSTSEPCRSIVLFEPIQEFWRTVNYYSPSK